MVVSSSWCPVVSPVIVLQAADKDRKKITIHAKLGIRVIEASIAKLAMPPVPDQMVAEMISNAGERGVNPLFRRLGGADHGEPRFRESIPIMTAGPRSNAGAPG